MGTVSDSLEQLDSFFCGLSVEIGAVLISTVYPTSQKEAMNLEISWPCAWAVEVRLKADMSHSYKSV